MSPSAAPLAALSLRRASPRRDTSLARTLCSACTKAQRGGARQVRPVLASSNPRAAHTSFGAWQSTASRVSGSNYSVTASSNSRMNGIPVIHTVRELREWRKQAMKNGLSVGFVPTMGALHAGHMSLVEASLQENDLTVVSIFVNPAQFAPHEDLGAYPRTLPSDSEALARLSSGSHKVDVIFAPNVQEMYPSGFTQVVDDQVGAFVEVKGLSHQMEGGSRPTFFRGVATVCTKLFHIVEPDRLYFGQKDIQQAVILRRLLKDLLFQHPERPEDLRVMPTGRDPHTGLALSSRNAYLSEKAKTKYAPCLYRALRKGEKVFNDEKSADAAARIQKTLMAARQVVLDEADRAKEDGVKLDLDYISLNDPDTLQNLEEECKDKLEKVDRAIMSGALLASDVDSSGKQGRVTRLIDNVLLGFKM